MSNESRLLSHGCTFLLRLFDNISSFQQNQPVENGNTLYPILAQRLRPFAHAHIVSLDGELDYISAITGDPLGGIMLEEVSRLKRLSETGEIRYPLTLNLHSHDFENEQLLIENEYSVYIPRIRNQITVELLVNHPTFFLAQAS